MRLPHPYRPEAEIVSQRLSTLAQCADWSHISRMALPWVQAVRDNPPPFWALESLLQEYPISSAEGLALMRLAEALLRVPDAPTAIALTADQLGRADFDSKPDSGLARLSSTAIALSKKLLPSDGGEPSLIARLGARPVVAATLRAVQLLGRQFVLGQNMTEAQTHAAHDRQRQPGLRFSFDMLGEGARTDADAAQHAQHYHDAIEKIAAHADPICPCEQNDGISIKLSALHPRYEMAQRERVMAELLPRVWALCQQAAHANIGLTIDAEEVDRLELSLELFEALAERTAAELPQWQGLGLVVQAYQTRAQEAVQWVLDLARRTGLRLMCRLAKGAYWDAEIKRAQELGLEGYPVFTHKHHTDIAYLACARLLLSDPAALYPQFATHNAGTIAAIVQMAALPSVSASVTPGPRFELQRLHGMAEGLYREVLKNPLLACRVYAPVGEHKDLLAYLVRRLLENGANTSFVHQLADPSVGLDTLLASPLRLEPQPSLPLPAQIYGPARRNSQGLDLTLDSAIAPLLHAYQTTTLTPVPEFNAKLATNAYAASAACYQIWSKTELSRRTTCLLSAADALQTQLPRFCALLVTEAHKTWPDAVAEVREAIDFLRYYAGQAERLLRPLRLPEIDASDLPPGLDVTLLGLTGEINELRLRPRGVWVCISPWNFPLAIFLGQIAAALVTGNTVLAKPAEQTPVVAQHAVRLLHDAGVPADALQLLHGPGETVGAALVALPGVAGVAFTGSTAVARLIARALAAKDGPIVPLIAETGGVNAMVVDSTALPEQVVDAVLQSAFRSAGQRCSALRLLCLHADIADRVLPMLVGATQELRVGDPAELRCDVGPVIDAEAYGTIRAQRERLMQHGKSLLAPVASASGASNSIANVISPTIVEVTSVADVGEEIFGPVLQVLRYHGDPLAVVEQINALGYGLTLGIQTRIDSRAQALAAAAHTGNVYVNRNQVGAVVGLQPFGGEGLSGTGPKAGGPHYLLRFCTEQTLTINTTAAGGNAALLAAQH